jgi:hypothetical protein
MNEKDVMRHVIDAAKGFGWERYHTHRSDFSPAGWPDEVLVRGARMVIAELKGRGKKPSPNQAKWLELLRHVEVVEVYLWTPDDLDDIDRILAPEGRRIIH